MKKLQLTEKSQNTNGQNEKKMFNYFKKMKKPLLNKRKYL